VSSGGLRTKASGVGRRVRRASELLRRAVVRHFSAVLRGLYVHRQSVIMCRPADLPVPTVNAGLPVRIELLREDQVDEYSSFYPWTAPDDARQRLRQGQLCFVARHEGKLVAADWASTESTYSRDLHCIFSLQPGDVYTYEIYTLPEFRRQRIATVIKVEILRHFRAAGCRRFLNLISPDNGASLHTNEKLGYRRVGLIGYWGLGPFRRHVTQWDGRCGEADDLTDGPKPG
jgi:GNAT superfamily N-acetyltransferase